MQEELQHLPIGQRLHRHIVKGNGGIDPDMGTPDYLAKVINDNENNKHNYRPKAHTHGYTDKHEYKKTICNIHSCS